MKNKKMLGNALLFLTAFIWGTAFVFQRVGMDYIEPFTFGAARMALAAVALAIVVFVTDKIKAKKAIPDQRSAEETAVFKKNTIVGGICCGLFLTIASSFQQFGVVYTTAGKAGFITALYMLFVPIIGFFFLKKKTTWLVWVGVFIGTFGMYLLCIKEGFSITRGDLLVFICAIFFSLHILCCDHFVQLGDALKISMIQFATCSALSWLLSFIFETPTIEKVISAAFPIFFCGILSGGLGYTLQMIAQKFTDPTVASLLMSLESVFAALAGWALLSEQMSSRELLGCIIMFSAIILVQIPLPERKES